MGIGSFTTMATEAMGTRVRMAHHRMSLNWPKRSCKYERTFEGTAIYIEDCKYHGAQDSIGVIKMELSTPPSLGPYLGYPMRQHGALLGGFSYQISVQDLLRALLLDILIR